MKKTETTTRQKPKNLGVTIGSIIILVFAAITFIFIPAMTGYRSKDELPPFGSYKGEKIEYKQGSRFADEVTRYAQYYEQNGQSLDSSAYYQILNYAFNSTVLSMAFTDEVEKSGYIVPQSAIDRGMLPYFQDTNGQYSAKIFRDTPDNTKLEIRKSVEEGLVSTRYQTDVLGDSASGYGASAYYGIKTSSKEIPFIADMNAKQRSFEMASFSINDYPESEAVAYGTKHPDLFVKYDLSAVVVPNESEAKKFLAQINRNEVTFEDAVLNYSSKNYTNTDGKVNNTFAYQLKNIFTSDDDFKTVTSLATGTVSGVIPVANESYAIFRADSAPQNPDMTDTNMVQTVHTYMTTYEAGTVEDYFVNIAKDFSVAAQTQGFAAAAEKFGGDTAELASFPLNYAENALLDVAPTTSIPQLNGASMNETFLRTAFSLKQNEISSPFVLGGNVVVLKLVEETTVEENSSVEWLFPYYSMQYDQQSVQSAFLTSDDVKNDVLSVFFSHFLGI